MSLGTFKAYAQGSSVLLGRVTEAGSGEIVPFAHVTIGESVIGTSTNLDGHFELRIPEGTPRPYTIKISCIGYKPSISEIHTIPNSRQSFTINPATTSLGSVVITADKKRKKLRDPAKQLVRKALKRIPKNYSDEPSIYPAFYRHYCAENDNYVRLIEAALELTRSGKDPYTSTIPQENLGFEVKQLRRSFDFTQNSSLSHPPISLNYLLTGDLTAYNYTNPLRDMPTKYAMLDTTYLDGNVIYVIQFHTKPTGLNHRYYTGKLFIEAESLAFVRIETTEDYGLRTIGDSTDILSQRICIYKEFNGQYHLDRSSVDLSGLHLSYDTLGQVVDSVVHTSHIELITNNILPNPSKRKGSEEPTSEDLVNVPYDSTFWDHYNILEATAMETKIIEDLSRKIDLRKQFALFNTIEEGGKSIIASEPFQEVLARYEGTPTYVVIWSPASRPNYFDIRPHTRFLRKLNRDKLQLVMVSIDDNDESWQLTRQLYKLDQKGIEHARISFDFDSKLLEELFNDVLPFYCFFDESGALLTTDPPLPSHQDIQFLIRSPGQNQNVEASDRKPSHGE